jgi:hypothetical protein
MRARPLGPQTHPGARGVARPIWSGTIVDREAIDPVYFGMLDDLMPRTKAEKG